MVEIPWDSVVSLREAIQSPAYSFLLSNLLALFPTPWLALLLIVVLLKNRNKNGLSAVYICLEIAKLSEYIGIYNHDDITLHYIAFNQIWESRRKILAPRSILEILDSCCGSFWGLISSWQSPSVNYGLFLQGLLSVENDSISVKREVKRCLNTLLPS